MVKFCDVIGYVIIVFCGVFAIITRSVVMPLTFLLLGIIILGIGKIIENQLIIIQKESDIQQLISEIKVQSRFFENVH